MASSDIQYHPSYGDLTDSQIVFRAKSAQESQEIGIKFTITDCSNFYK